MKNIKITIDGKTYEKMRPTIEDWLSSLENEELMSGKNIMIDKEAGAAAIEIVAGFFGISADEIKNHGDLEEVITAYQLINGNIIEAFSSAASVWGKNAASPGKVKD